MLSPPSIEDCRLCGHQCGVNRLAGELGQCGLGAEVLVASSGPHYGEEPELVGTRGSGTIFFAGCNLACQFCQNWEISQLRQGEAITIEDLARQMLHLERIGCHNVNLVTPTPYTPSILEAARLAREQGLAVPLVYNCGGFESPEALALCEGWIEIYMPDAKYSDAQLSAAFSGAPAYPEVSRRALCEMHRQVGNLVISGGLASHGLLVRHLVLPQYPENARGVLKFLAEEISAATYVNVMDQYLPAYQAAKLPGMDRCLTRAEYQQAVDTAHELGLARGF